MPLIVRRRGDKGRPLTYELPSGPLVKLLLAHITEGHTLLTQAHGGHVYQLFTTSVGNPFTDVTFCQYWKTLMNKVDTKGQKYFKPTLARTMFINEFTAVHGSKPELFDGCAEAMGNSVKTWTKNYWTTRKDKQAAAAIDAHTRAREVGRSSRKMAMGGDNDEDGEEEERANLRAYQHGRDDDDGGSDDDERDG